ncbi:MAG: hypothetical protein K8Q89_09380 [Nitrosarchaeum sp.]|nr:hypothetical protein [Nitrosarchaeum sp.]
MIDTTYTESAMSDNLKNFFNTFKDSNRNYKYVDMIDSSITDNKIIEINHDDFTEEIKQMISSLNTDVIHRVFYRAICEVLQVRYGSSIIGLKEENKIKFTITNAVGLNSKIFDSPHNEDPIKSDEIIELKNLIQIENPEYTGKAVKVKAVVASNTISYNVPDKIEFKCKNNRDNHNCIRYHLYKISLDTKAGFTEVNEITRLNRKKFLAETLFENDCNITVDEIKTSTIKKLRIKPIVTTIIEDRDGNLVDDEGNEYKHYDIFLEQNEVQSLEAGKEVEITGRIIPDPKSQKVTLIATKISKLDDEHYSLENIRKLRDFYHFKSTEQITRWFADEFQTYSKIVKRQTITIAGILAFFSSIVFEFEGKRYSGWVKTLIMGDSTTGKSEIMRRLILLFKSGQMISAETASIVGLTATASQSSGNQWFVEWGVLPLNDKRLLVIDGAHKLSKEHWDTIAETERDGILNIQKASKGKTHARTRQVKVMNPIGEDYKTTKAMKNFYYPAQAIVNSLQIQSIARQDVAVFVTDNVSSSDRNVRCDQQYDKMIECYADLLKLVWLQKYDIVFEDDAINAILEEATKLENLFKDEDIPLITNDQKIKLARLGVSVANFCISFNSDFTELRVTREHIEFVSNYLRSNYFEAGLDKLSKINADVDVDKELIQEIVSDISKILENHVPEMINDDILKMIEWMAGQSQFTKDTLMTKYNLADKNETRRLIPYLKAEGLLNSKKGFIPTKKLIMVGKFIVDCKNKGVSFFEYGKEGKPVEESNYKCNNCFAMWKNTAKTLVEIQKEHQLGNPGHIISKVID